MKFNTFIHDVRILKALDALGFHDLTSVQQNTIPVLLDNKDCIVQSKEVVKRQLMLYLY